MKPWALEYLRCVACGASLTCEAFEAASDGDTTTGVLDCSSAACRTWYPIVRGVPRMLPVELRRDATREFSAAHRTALGDRAPADQPAASNDPLKALKTHTIRNFGFEWIEYARFGWDDPVHNIAYEEALFRRKALLTPEEIRGKLVLDAGCGNGRYSYWAAQYGARVIGVDLGDGVESAHANTRDLPTVQIVQADIFRLPFAPHTFDAIFSIGVLMHTGNAKLATSHLTTKVRPGGTITVHLYGKGNVIYEFVDWALRVWTTRLSIEKLQRVTSRFFRLRQTLDRLGLATLANRFIRVGPHPHIIFDWYAAPIATHHTYPEVLRWFQEFGVPVLATNEPPPGSWPRRLARPLVGLPDVVTVRGKVVG